MYKALISGFIGACALSLLNETVRQFVKDAPRADVMGERALAATIEAAGVAAPKPKNLYYPALAGDLLSNAGYYSLVSLGGRNNAPLVGAALGAAGGLATAYLPEHLGLGKSPTNRTPQTAAMTVAWYTVGGLAAGFAFQALTDSDI